MGIQEQTGLAALIIMLGGVIMNVLVAFLIYAFVLMIWGERKRQ
jgi:hypothetical protein